MILVSTEFVPEKTIVKNLGLVRGNTIRARHLGRDILSRLIIGTRVALGVAVPSVLAALMAGLIFGLVAGYTGGWLDNVIIVVMDAIQAFPALLLALALMALLDPSITNVILVIAIAYTPGYARIVRAIQTASRATR